MLVGWSGLFLVLCLASFGFYGLFQLTVCFLVFLVSLFVTVLVIGEKWAEDYWNKASISRLELPGTGLSTLKEMIASPANAVRFDKRLTGSSVIDEHLQEVVQLTLRDYVHLWYRQISDDDRFPDSLQESAQQVIISFSNRIKDVDWVQFFTVQLFEDVVSHFRLFRQAQHKLCQKKNFDGKATSDLVSTFFELENEMNSESCWEEICTKPEEEKVYLRDLTEVLLYLLLRTEDFGNKAFRYLARELLVGSIMLPVIDKLADPDYINQTIIWLCKDVPLTSEVFLTILRLTNSVDELLAILEKVNQEIAVQRSRDSGGNDDAAIKQQLSSLLFVKRVVDHRLNRLQEGVDTDSAGLPAGFDWRKILSANYKLYSLPLDSILKNNIALSYFIDFMMCTGNQAYMFFYLTVEGYRVSAEQLISQLRLEFSGDQLQLSEHLEPLREAAINIYDQYLSTKAMPRIKLDENLVKQLDDTIKSDVPSETWFDEIQTKVLDILSEDRFLGTFCKSPQYIKMLAELDLLKDTSKSEEDDLTSLGEFPQTNSDSVSMSSLDDSSAQSDSAFALLSTLIPGRSREASSPTLEGLTVKTKIVGTGVIKDAITTYVVYAVEVVKSVVDSKEEKWQAYRRYSDFLDFHLSLVEKYGHLVGHHFPGKKAFNNMNPEFLGKRMQQLNDYLQFLLSPEMIAKYANIQEDVLHFLEPVSYSKSRGQLVKKVNKVVNPIRQGVQSMGTMVRAVPDNVIQTVDNMMDNLCRALHGKSESSIGQLGLQESVRMTAGLDYDNEEDIPLRILLLLVDEVFDLKSRNQWLRRRMVVLLREFIKTMYGDRINRTIVDYVKWLTSADQIAQYIKTFRNTMWPNGIFAGPSPPRDHNTMMRTRVIAKVAMLTFLPDEMKHIIGSETTRRGIHLVFEMFQHQALNRRLSYTLCERVIKLVFPENNIPKVLSMLHSKTKTPT